MKMSKNPQNRGCYLKQAGKVLAAALPALLLMAFPGSANAQNPLPYATTNFVWDPGIANPTGPSDGSGYWDDAVNQNWLSNRVTAAFWPASGTNTVWIGAGGPGPYYITNQNAIITSGVIFSNANNYTLSGAQITFPSTGGGSGWIGVYSCAGATNTISETLASSLGTTFSNALNSQLTLAGGFSFGNTYFFLGSHNLSYGSQPAGTVWLTGNQSGQQEIYNSSGTLNIESVNLNVTNAVLEAPRLDAGAGGVNTITILNVYNNGQANGNAGHNGNNGGNNFQVSRSGSTGIVNVYPGGLVSSEVYSAAAANSDTGGGDVLIVGSDSGAAQAGMLNVLGGTVLVGDGPYTYGQVGQSSVSLLNIDFYFGPSTAATVTSHTNFAILNLSSGTVTANEIKFAAASGIATYNPTNGIIMTGGTLYLGAPNFYTAGAWSAMGTNFICDLSGGTLSAIANWTPVSTMPVTLETVNGNVTFQTADISGSPFNMAFGGPITGAGGFNLIGGGTLTLSGSLNYSGSTVLSNGTLAVSTANAPVCGPVTLEGANASSGYPVDSVQVLAAGQQLTANGNLTYDTGTPKADFQFNGFVPSTSVAPIQVNGNLAFNVTPNVSVEANELPVGTYPLIQYTGTLSGTPPTSVTLSNIYSGTISNSPSSKTIYLVITSSTYVSGITWATGNGNWDFVTQNWVTNNITPTLYADGDGVTFNDSHNASGLPVTVTVTPASVSPAGIAVSTTNSYTMTGGAIAGAGSLAKAGSGTLTLSGLNTFSGGTTVSGGTLNINNGGNSANNSAIGTGTLTMGSLISGGGAIGNSSGQPVTLLPSIPSVWNNRWSFVGPNNLDLGDGLVTMNMGIVLTVVTNSLEIDGQISDNGNGYKLSKFGAGTLILSNANNNFSGGLDVTAGQVDLNSAGAEGGGPLTLVNCSFDNTSGSVVALNPPATTLSLGNCTFIGSTNLDLGNGTISAGGSTITVSNSTLLVEGGFTGASSQTTINGPGAFEVGGTGITGSTTFNFNNGVTFYCNRAVGGTAINIQGANLSAGSAIVVLNPTGSQFNDATITWNGGLLELNGDSENLGTSAMNSGTLSDNGSSATVNFIATGSGGATLTLGAGNDVINVTNGSIFTINGNVTGTATNSILVKTGAGEAILTTNSYAGNTTVSNGVLSIVYPNLSTNSTVTIASGAVLDLNFTNSIVTTNVVAALIVNGVNEPKGVYNSNNIASITSGGSLLVVPPITTNPNPGPIQFSPISGNTWNLAWPTNAGWLLQVQTNSLQTGLGTNWVTIPGSASITSTNIIINPANGATFFRLMYP